MKRSRQVLILPLGIAGAICVGFALGFAFPALDLMFYIAFILVGGAAIILADRLSARKLEEPRSDERLEGIAKRAMMVAFRIASFASIAFILVAQIAFPANTELRLVAVGANIAVAFQGLVLGVISKMMEARG